MKPQQYLTVHWSCMARVLLLASVVLINEKVAAEQLFYNAMQRREWSSSDTIKGWVIIILIYVDNFLLLIIYVIISAKYNYPRVVN